MRYRLYLQGTAVQSGCKRARPVPVQRRSLKGLQSARQCGASALLLLGGVQVAEVAQRALQRLVHGHLRLEAGRGKQQCAFGT